MSQHLTTSGGVKTTRQAVPSGKLSYEEFLAWLDDETHAEWVEGEVVFVSPVTDRHQDLLGFLLALFRIFSEERGLGTVRTEPFQMKVGPDLPGRAPDLLFVAREHRHRLKRTYVDGPADLVVEIISQDSVQRDRRDKFGEYQEGGVSEYWLIDPERAQAEFFQLDDQGVYRRAAVGDDGIYRSAALPDLWLKVEWLYQDPLPSLMSVLRAWGLV